MTEVKFPGLGWSFNIDNVMFHIGSTEIYWYSICVCGGMLICAILAMLESRKNRFSEDVVADIMLVTIPCAIVGARAYYVLCEWDYYKGNIHRILDIRGGGLAVYGGIILTVIGLFIMCRVRKIPFDSMMDFGLLYVPLGQAIGRWGNFFNQEAFGTTTNLPWGMTSAKVSEYLTLNCPNLDPNMPVHPTFFYESCCNLILFFILRQVRKKSTHRYETASLYLVGYGIIRFFVEGLRTDSLYIGHTGIRTSQLLSAILVVVGLAVIFYSHYADLERNYLPEHFFTVKIAPASGKSASHSKSTNNKQTSKRK